MKGLELQMREFARQLYDEQVAFIFKCPDYQSNAIGMPRQAKLKNKAILADTVLGPGSVKMRHKKGINVLYANGSGQWVDLKVLENAPMPAPDQTWTKIPGTDVNYTYSPRMLDESVNPPTGVWVAMDKESR